MDLAEVGAVDFGVQIALLVLDGLKYLNGCLDWEDLIWGQWV
jgi:hypothetical protein